MGLPCGLDSQIPRICLQEFGSQGCIGMVLLHSGVLLPVTKLKLGLKKVLAFCFYGKVFRTYSRHKMGKVAFDGFEFLLFCLR